MLLAACATLAHGLSDGVAPALGDLTALLLPNVLALLLVPRFVTGLQLCAARLFKLGLAIFVQLTFPHGAALVLLFNRQTGSVESTIKLPKTYWWVHA